MKDVAGCTKFIYTYLTHPTQFNAMLTAESHEESYGLEKFHLNVSNAPYSI